MLRIFISPKASLPPQRSSSFMNRGWPEFRAALEGRPNPSQLLLWVVFFMSLLIFYFCRTGCRPYQ